MSSGLYSSIKELFTFLRIRKVLPKPLFLAALDRKKVYHQSWVWWSTPIIPALRQENHEFKPCQAYIVRPYLNNNKKSGAGGVTQVVKLLPRKWEALSSTPSTEGKIKPITSPLRLPCGYKGPKLSPTSSLQRMTSPPTLIFDHQTPFPSNISYQDRGHPSVT
jgi:hypothetical protein